MNECSFSFLFPIQPENQPITVYLTLAVYLARGLASLSVRVLALSHSSSYSDSSAWSNTTGSEERCISFSMTSSWFTYIISLRPFMTSSWPTYDLLMTYLWPPHAARPTGPGLSWPQLLPQPVSKIKLSGNHQDSPSSYCRWCRCLRWGSL